MYSAMKEKQNFAVGSNVKVIINLLGIEAKRKN